MSPSIIHYNGDSISHIVNASLLVQVLRWVLKCLLSIDFQQGYAIAYCVQILFGLIILCFYCFHYLAWN